MTNGFRFANVAESLSMHQVVYGEKILETIIPVEPDTKFPFLCKQTGKCCRRLEAGDATVPLESETRRIKHYCQDNRIQIQGIIHGKTLHLDGQTQSKRLKTTVRKSTGELVYRDPSGATCQFLSAEGQCGIYAARPFHCRLYPLGFVVDYQEKVIALALYRTLKDRCPECFETENLVTVAEHVGDTFTDKLLLDLELNHVVGARL